MANALTIDVEDYFQVGVFQASIRPEDWGEFELRVERNLHLIRELLDRRGIKATFFVLGWVAERIPGLIAELAAAGHEIGSHGHGHRPIWHLDRESFRDDVRRSQGILGDILGAAPTSYRAPCFSVTRETLWALEILHEEGIRQDSSIFPVRHPEYGIPGSEKDLYRIALPAGGEILEFPMTVGRLAGRELAFCGGGWFRLFPYWLTRKALTRSAAEGRPFVFYLHPWELDPEQPRLYRHAGLLGRFRHYVNLGRNQRKFERLLDEFTFSSMGEVFAQRLSRGPELPVLGLDELAAG
ncbi:MAG: DUF3473 domain-containing protein [Planctomycetes bacterium]|nr:DUF3473 domain-containing protein [Planctomycetota bacterium]